MYSNQLHCQFHLRNNQPVWSIQTDLLYSLLPVPVRCQCCRLPDRSPSQHTSRTSILYLYLYSAQYLYVLQDSKRYMTHSTVQVPPNSQITDIPLTERQRLKDDHLSTSLRFFNLPLGIGPNDIRTTIYICLYLGLNPHPLCSYASVLPLDLSEMPVLQSTGLVSQMIARPTPSLLSTLWKKKARLLTKRLACQKRNRISSFLKSRTTGKLLGVSSCSWGGNRYQNLRVQPRLR